MKLRGIALSAALLAISGCSDSTGPITGFNGALSFTFTGAGGGSYSAQGDFTASGGSDVQSWSVGARDDANTGVAVVSNMPRSSTTHDMLFMGIARTSAGGSTFSASCDPEDTSDVCTGLVFYRGMNTTGTYEFFCVLTSGTVSITSISASRVQGTFSGAGLCFDNEQNEESFTVTGGTFNVALIDTQLD